MKRFIFGLALALGIIGILAGSVHALDTAPEENCKEGEMLNCARIAEPTETTAVKEPIPTFVVDNGGSNLFNLKIGKNQLIAGNNFTSSAENNGLIFAFGNNVSGRSKSEYLFTAGNNVTFTGEVKKDLFVAGNNVQIKPVAKIGGDIYAAGNVIIMEGELAGDFSATAKEVIFKDVKISGNVNLSVEEIVFEGKVTVDGVFTYNSNAIIDTYNKNDVQVYDWSYYILESKEVSPAVIWLGRLLSATGLFATLLLLVLAFPRSKERIVSATMSSNLGSIIISGLGSLILVPIIAILLLMTYVATTTGLVLLVVFLVLLYVAQAFAGAYFGHLIFTGIFRTHKAPLLAEAALGIALIICLEAIPALNFLIGFVATVFGLGTIVAIIRPSKINHHKIEAKSSPKVIPPKSADDKNPFRGQSQKAQNQGTSKSNSKSSKSRKK